MRNIYDFLKVKFIPAVYENEKKLGKFKHFSYVSVGIHLFSISFSSSIRCCTNFYKKDDECLGMYLWFKVLNKLWEGLELQHIIIWHFLHIFEIKILCFVSAPNTIFCFHFITQFRNLDVRIRIMQFSHIQYSCIRKISNHKNKI